MKYQCLSVVYSFLTHYFFSADSGICPLRTLVSILELRKLFFSLKAFCGGTLPVSQFLESAEKDIEWKKA